MNASGTTIYIGDHSELIPNVKWTQYYSFGGQRVAVRDGGGGPVSWLHGDNPRLREGKPRQRVDDDERERREDE